MHTLLRNTLYGIVALFMVAAGMRSPATFAQESHQTVQPEQIVLENPLVMETSIAVQPDVIEWRVTVRTGIGEPRSFPGTMISFTIPESLSPLSDLGDYVADISPERPAEIVVRLAYPRLGAYRIAAQATFLDNQTSGFGASQAGDLTVTSDGAVYRSLDEQVVIPQMHVVDSSQMVHSLQGEPSSLQELESSQATSAILSGNIKIHATILTPTGSNSYSLTQQDVPLRYARVRLVYVDSRTYVPVIYPVDYHTSSSGNYSMTITDSNVLTYGLNPRLLISARDDAYVAVKGPGLSSVYEIEAVISSGAIVNTTYNYTIGSTNTTVDPKPFFVYDTLSAYARAVYSGTGWNRNTELTVGYPVGCQGIPEMLYGDTGGCMAGYLTPVVYLSLNEAWDKDVLTHEYTHYILSTYIGRGESLTSCLDSSLGPWQHGFGLHSSARCAWTEAWGSFIPAAIKGDGYYRDSLWPSPGYGNNRNFGSVAIADLAAITSNKLTNADDELAVAASLWDVYDATGSTWDTVTWSNLHRTANDGIWDLSVNNMAATGHPPYVLHEFMAAWTLKPNAQWRQMAEIARHYRATVLHFYPTAIRPSGSQAARTIGVPTATPAPLRGYPAP